MTSLDYRKHVATLGRRLGIVVGLFLHACAGGPGTAASTLPEQAPPALPSLPQNPLAALPSWGDATLWVDVAALRREPLFATVEAALEGSCYATKAMEAALRTSEQLALTISSEAEPSGFVLAVQVAPGALGAAELAEGAGLALYGTSTTATQAAPVGRLSPVRAGGLLAAELAPGLLLLATEVTFTTLAQSYDDPQRTPAGPYPELQTEPGQVVLWTRDGAVPGQWMGQVSQGLGRAFESGPLGLSLGQAVDGTHLHLRAALQDPAAATSVINTVRGRIQGASLMLRMLGLSGLEQRLLTQQAGGLLEMKVQLTPQESERLLAMGQMQAKNLLREQCSAARAAGGAL